MKLADVKRLAVRGGYNIRFALPNGLECLVDCHGVARVPGLNAPPSFNLEQQLAGAQVFIVEAVPRPGQRKSADPKRQLLSRSQLEEWLSPADGAGLSAED